MQSESIAQSATHLWSGPTVLQCCPGTSEQSASDEHASHQPRTRQLLRIRQTGPCEYVAPLAMKADGSTHGSLVLPHKELAIVAGQTACGSRCSWHPIPCAQSASEPQSFD